MAISVQIDDSSLYQNTSTLTLENSGRHDYSPNGFKPLKTEVGAYEDDSTELVYIYVHSPSSLSLFNFLH